MAKIDKKEWVTVEVRQVGIMVGGENEEGLVILSDVFNPQNVILIITGGFEARAIGFTWVGKKLPRPLTHDLFHNVIQKVGAKIKAVFITELKGNTYYAKILLKLASKQIEVDSRPSDAIALALRANAQIFVAKNLMRRTKDLLEEEREIVVSAIEKNPQEIEPTFSSLIIKEMMKLIEEAIARKEYERAARLKDRVIELMERMTRKEQPESSTSETEIKKLTKQMWKAAEREDYETAAKIRDKINALITQKGDQ